MMRKVLIGSAALVAALGMAVVVQPATYHVERSLLVHAPAEAAHALVNDFHAWRQWSPFEDKDLAMRRTYGGAPAGVGATYAWASDGQVGEGKMTILQSSTRGVNIELSFLKPMRATSTATFTFTKVGDDTKVTWAMDGENTLPSKVAHLFFNMDKALGAEFERGLDKLKSAAERAVAANLETAKLK